jgi:hypothetical protein
MNFEMLGAILREMIQDKEFPLRLNNGRYWEVADREKNLQLLRERIFDRHLELVKQISIDVLSEIDPQFALPSAERWSAAFNGEKLRYSKNLREGLAELIAWLGINGDMLVNCSDNRSYIALLVIREIFSKANWQLWGSLNDLLPTLAEAAPGEFLSAVEHSLRQTPCPFDELFAQEDTGIGGRNYMTGLLWALEGLAWDEEYLMRVCVVLAELASHDPGGNWANRPANSITNILLPWHPQTFASINKRVTSIKAIKSDFPEAAWKILLTLLPSSHQTTLGTHKPRWRNAVPDDWKPVVTHAEYWEQIAAYAGFAVEMACEYIDRLIVLAGHLDNLPQPSFDAILDFLSSDAITSLSEIERMPIWTSLSDLVRKHRRFADAVWALDEQLVAKIEVVAERLSPVSAEVLYRRLFSNRDFDLYEENDNWEEQHRKLELRREQAIQEVLKAHGIQGVISFINDVEAPNQVGWVLGKIADVEITTRLLPKYLDVENRSFQQFTSGFVWSCYQTHGWQWVDGLNHANWSLMQRCQFLMNLPFESETWHRASVWLGDSENMYWQAVQVNPYQAEGDLLYAADKLLEVARPQAAIECLYARIHKQLPLDGERTIKSLLAALSTSESINNIDSYHITELIKALQDDTGTDQDGLFRVEWAYLPLLNEFQGAAPKLLEKKLANEPSFFCEVISLIYRSKHAEKKDEQPDEHTTAIATNAWRLLNQWKRAPGVQDDGSFSSDYLEAWLSSVKERCSESGHFEVSMNKVGQVLLYCPPDPTGLWIIESVAKALNARDAEEMRNGFRTEVFNSRGAHWVDPTGKPERELAELWRQRAEAVENMGFARFAATLRDLTKSYDRDAERIVVEHKSENPEE